MTKTAWTEHIKACKGLGLSREEIRQWYWAEKEAKEAELDEEEDFGDPRIQTLLEKSAQDYIKRRNVSAPLSARWCHK